MKSLILLMTVIVMFLISTVTSAEVEHERRVGGAYEKNESSEQNFKKIYAIKKTQKTKKILVKPKTPTTSAKVVSPMTPPASITPVSTSVTHTSSVNYNTPEWSVPVVFSVTVKNGVIIAASSTTKAGGTSRYYQDSFAGKISSIAVGKKIAQLNLNAIGGASLTTSAFERFVSSNF